MIFHRAEASLFSSGRDNDARGLNAVADSETAGAEIAATATAATAAAAAADQDAALDDAVIPRASVPPRVTRAPSFSTMITPNESRQSSAKRFAPSSITKAKKALRAAMTEVIFLCQSLATSLRQTQAYAARVQEAHSLLQEQADRTRAEAAEARDRLEQQLQVGTGAGVGGGSKAQQAGRPSTAAAPRPAAAPQSLQL